MEDINKGEIYIIKNIINNKIYIGQTKCVISGRKYGAKTRWQVHKYRASKCSNDCNIFYNAIRKYGEEKFQMNILIKCNIDDLDFYEKKYIKEYNSLYPNGYNIENGGHLNKKLSDKTKDELSELKRFKHIKNKDDINEIKEIMIKFDIKNLPRGFMYTSYNNKKGFLVSIDGKIKGFTSNNRTIEENFELALKYYNIYKNNENVEEFINKVNLDEKLKCKSKRIKYDEVINAMKNLNINELPLYIRYEKRNERFFVKKPDEPNKYFSKNDPTKSLEEALNYLKTQSLREDHMLIPQNT
jgi:group I intron endonuclease